MADNQQQDSNPGEILNSFTKGMMKDANETFISEGLYTHARNAVNNSHTGQVGVIGNEPSTLECVSLPYILIGCINILNNRWTIFTTDNYDSEIGIFDETDCSYTKVVNDKCLNFKTTNLITGAYRERYDCQKLVYFDDGLNPSRVLDLDDVPYIVTKTITNDCVLETPTNALNCESIRLAPLLTYPCITLTKGRGSGTLFNGSYQVVMAYTINQVKVSDYIGITEVQSLFSHENFNGSLEAKIESIDTDFDEFELVLISNVNEQTTAKRIGFYSTNLSTIYIDRIDSEAVSIPIPQVILRTEPIEKSDSMYTVGDYLLRLGTYSKFRFNYQIQANKIQTSWMSVEYPASYYHDGGNNTGYMRDEQYAFFIRWIYNTGDRSDSYHIPGRKATPLELFNQGGQDAFENSNGVLVKTWQVENTAKFSTIASYTLPDGGKVIAKGQMGYWESTEKYPDNKPEVWGDLCGKPIRHHKMPDETLDNKLSIFSNTGKNINLIGVQFSNITPPLDLDGNVIESIVGYEILRGSRESNKTIISKGLINNMRQYDIPGQDTYKGLYQNYPFNDLRQDTYLTSSAQLGNNAGNNNPSLSVYKKDIFSFHGPELSFYKPYLDAPELKIYQEVYGDATGKFEVPYKHPKMKIAGDAITDISTVMAALNALAKIVGTAVGGDAKLDIQGTENIPFTSSLITPHRSDVYNGYILPGTGTGGGASGIAPLMLPTGNPTGALATNKRSIANTTISTTNGVIVTLLAPFTFKAQQQQLFSIFYGFIPKRQYAAQYVSYGLYNSAVVNPKGNRRRKIVDSRYVSSTVQGFNSDYQIQNANRSGFVVVQTELEVDDPTTIDDSRFTMQKTNFQLNTTTSSKISSYYGALKIPLPSQYGQIDSIKQLSITACIQPTEPIKGMKYTSPVLFGGDVYINRFTEKNSMFFFDTWLSGEPDQYEIDYTLYSSLPYPRFWLNTNEIHSEFINNAKKYYSLDGVSKKAFYVNRGYFYLFNSGVRDFFVESEINLAYRDWDESIAKRHYDPYRFTDLQGMFRSDIIQAGNFYKYDNSLSISKLFNSSISWGNALPKDYDPYTANTCYTYRSTRVLYSLPIQYQSKKDNWRSFLANNYTDFVSEVTSIKSINMTGALFMLKSQSPLKFIGVEELKLDAGGTKITVGDGGLFTQDNQLQSIVNADSSYEYASCQNKYSAIGTNYGVFWVSQNQGKVFNYSSGLAEISNNGMRWWFAKYLPSELLKVFPNYLLYDNPVSGVGVQTIYDNTNEIVYITKKDYKPIIDLTYEETTGRFYSDTTGTRLYYTFDNQTAFEDASWTISYDPKTKSWISFHDWIPSFLIPGKNHFMSVYKDVNASNKDIIWKHNVLCNSYCNFYNVDYPFEVEFVSSTGQTITTLRNIEYQLEAYQYYNDCKDKFHLLDRNFDEALIYNTEQVSGMLQLFLKPKNNPIAVLDYPATHTNWINILYSKEENKFRFNQFWDITRDRGEFRAINLPALPNHPMFNTEANGYKFEINPDYVDYGKSPLEHKKFRHYFNKVFLRKKISRDVKFLFKLSNQKIQQSFR